ncbi:TonB-dependent receptor-like protein [Gelidibacter algens]|uniref:TonB-dependent receptor-like protein n=1 Tax=Gelidibacter algens TaxID=49280 RepID=A0A327SFC0_9FLAO|nr:TonB-dependent receptor [Gelidibacter algens]RAJ27726.1 TonB-dependent receptor-like protein [Gelidibacter algens]
MSIKSKYSLSILICLLSYFSFQGQEKSQKLPITEVLGTISTLHQVSFNYESNFLTDIKVYPPADNLDLSAKISLLEKQTNFVFDQVSAAIITISNPIKVCGYIIDASAQQPLLGATITGTSAYAVSDENGYFELVLKSSKELLTIRYIGFKTIERQVKFFNSGQCDPINMLEQQELINAVLIEGYLVKGIDKNKDWSTSIDYSKFTLLPGLIESDVLQTVQALPSILSVDETVSNINIRGGTNDQNLMLWDGIKMYQTGHFFGLISSFNPHMTQVATVINNGTDVALTDGVSGTINMQTEQKIDSKFGGIFGLNFLNAELFSNIPIGKKSSLQVASRKSLDELVRTPTYDVYFDRVTQDTEAQENVAEVTSSNQEFNFYDTSLRWLYNPTDKDFLRLNFILISNELSFNETVAEDSILRIRQSNVAQNSMAVGFDYKRQWNDRLSSTLNIYNSDYKLQAQNADVLAMQLFLQKNSVSETNIKFENVYSQDLWQFKLGYSFIETEVINLNDIDLPRYVRRDEEIVREHGAFTQAWYTNANRDFSVRAGVRANYITKFEKLILEPRLSVRKAIGDHLELEVLGEFKHQNTSQIVNFQNDFLGIEKRRWQLTDNDSIPIIESKQASMGLIYKNDGWLLDVHAYYKTVDGITTQSQSFTTKYEFEKEKGNYDAYGFELLFRKKLNKISSWLSYSYLNNAYTFATLKEIEFPNNFDITHSITLGSTYSNKDWDISAGVNYRTGKPTSIPVSENEVMNDVINFDRANNNRIQDYLRLDASAIYKFRISDSFNSEIGASVWNISNRENTINNYFKINEDDRVDQFSRFSLGLTTNAVVRIYF